MLAIALACAMMLPVGIASADAGGESAQENGRAASPMLLSLASPQETWGPFSDETGTWSFTVIKIDNGYYASIAGCLDEAQHAQMVIPQQVRGSVTIAGELQLDTFDVVAIGDGAFKNKGFLESITVPSSVTSVGESAFEGCVQLASADFSHAEQLETIPPKCFYGCIKLTTANIPASVKTIGESAFEDCSTLCNLTIGDPSDLASVGKSAFKGCAALEAVTLPYGVEVIGDMAFANCTGLGSVTFANPSLASIGVSAFEGCSSLQEVYLPDSIGTLGYGAFKKCTALKLVAYGKKLPVSDQRDVFEGSPVEVMIFPGPIGDSKVIREAAGWNESMAYLTVVYDSNDDSDTSDARISKIVPGDDCTAVTIPATIRKHGIVAVNGQAAKDQAGLTGVTFPDDSKITRIGANAFNGCKALQSITIPASVTELGDGVFQDCSSLWDIRFNTTSLKEIPSWAFAGCGKGSHQIDLVIPEGVTTIKGHAFDEFGKALNDPFGPNPKITLPESLRTIEAQAFNVSWIWPVCMPDAQDPITFNDVFSGHPDSGKKCFLYDPYTTTYQVTFGSWSEDWVDDLIASGILFDNETFSNKEYVPVDLPTADKWTVADPDYTGEQVFPTLSATRMLKDLELGKQYTIAPAEGDDCTLPGPHSVVVTGVEPYFKSDSSITLNYTIGSAPLSGDNVKMNDYGPFIWDDEPYPGGSVGDPTFTIELAGKTIDLQADVDYTLEYDDDTIGPSDSVTVTLKAKSGGLYTGSQAFTYKIMKADLNTADVVVENQTYTGGPLKPKPTVARLKDRDGKYPDELNLVEGEDNDYTIKGYENNVNVGTARMEMKATEVCITGTKIVEFTIDPADIGDGVISNIDDVVYSGEEQKPEPVVTWKGRTLEKGKDYSVSYESNVDAGTASVIVTGEGNFTGSLSSMFEITQLDISGGGCTVVVPYSVYAEDKDYRPHPSSVTMTVSGGKELTLAENTDYTCARWEHEGEDRFGHVTIEGQGNFKGECRTRFEIISDGDLSHASVGKIPDQVFTGGPFEPDLLVRFYDVDLLGRRDVEYTAKFVNNVNVGKATVILTGLGEITGTLETTFEIVPASIKDAVVTASNQVYAGTALTPAPTVTWNEMLLIEGKDYEVTGYAQNVHAGTATVTVKGIGNFEGSASGTFEIGKRSLDITADSAERDYDGTPLTADGVTAEKLAADDRIASATVEGSQTEAGSSPNVASGAKVENAKGEDVTDDYTISYHQGTLTVTPKAAVITVDNASKVFGGVDPVFSGTIDGLVNKDDLGKVTYIRTGSDEAVGTYKGVLTAEYTANSNYNVSVVKGDFTIVASYTVIWLDGDGSQLDRATWIEGDAEPTTAKVPTKKDDAEYTYSFAGWDEGAWDAAHAVKTYTPQFDKAAKAGVYRVVSGADSTWTQGSSDPLTFVIKRTVDDETTIDHFVGVEVDGAAVLEKDASGRVNYTVKSGSAIVSLQPAYLGTLSEGKHTVTAFFDDAEGGTSASFTVAAKAGPTPTPDPDDNNKDQQKGGASAAAAKGASPATGDPFTWAVTPLAIAAACALLLAVLAFRRRVQRK